MPPQFPSRVRFFSIGRLLVIVGLAALVGMMLGPIPPPEPSTLPADVLYRLSVFARAIRQWDQAEALEQTALALYERVALGAAPSAQATYRLGIFYSKSGYPDHGHRFLQRAAQLDEAHRLLYRLLSEIYDEGPVDTASLLNDISLLEDQQGWLARLTQADMYERIGERSRSAQLRQQWEHQQVVFGLVVSGVMMVWGLLGLVGLVILARAVVRLARHPTRPRARRVYVPWHLLDMTEAVVVLVALMAGLGMVATILCQNLHLPDSSAMVRVGTMAVVYLLASGATLALIRYRIGHYPQPWRALGLRFDGLATHLGRGVAGYGAFVCLLVVSTLALGKLGLIGTLPATLAQLKGPMELLTQTQPPAAYVVYFMLICIIAPVVEEIIFRGFIYAGLRRVMAMGPAMVLSAAVFAVIHVGAPPAGQVVIGLIALVLAYLYEHSRSVVPSMVAHSLHNTLLFVMLAAYGLL